LQALLALCWCFGVFNGALCFSGEVRSVWIPTVPGFTFIGHSFIAELLYLMDFYFAEAVIILSLVCYVAVLGIIIHRGDAMKTMRVQGPMILHFGTIFAMTAIVLFLWHHPPSDQDFYGHAFNLLVLLRFCISPLLALITSR
ncbi:hypothetical protein COOONC_16648, partial [Cooperia oncophora]